MGILLGFIMLLFFLLLAAKGITRKMKFQKADKMLMKLHKPFCGVLVLLSALHIVFVIPVWNTRNMFVNISGMIIIILMLLLILLGHKMKHNKNNRLMWHRILTVSMLASILWHIVIYNIDFQRYQSIIKSINIEETQLSDLEDGEYIGEYDAGYIYVKVKVVISDYKIKDILLLEHKNERGKEAEQIIGTVIETQKLPVDAVSGATSSSNVIQKAIENAINSTK